MKEKPAELEGSVMMRKKGEGSQTCLMNVFNFFLLAEPPGNTTGKGLLEEAVGVCEESGWEQRFLLHPPTPSSGPSTSAPCQEDGAPAAAPSPCPRHRKSANTASAFPASRRGVPLGRVTPWLALGPCDMGAAEETPAQWDWPPEQHFN